MNHQHPTVNRWIKPYESCTHHMTQSMFTIGYTKVEYRPSDRAIWVWVATDLFWPNDALEWPWFKGLRRTSLGTSNLRHRQWRIFARIYERNGGCKTTEMNIFRGLTLVSPAMRYMHTDLRMRLSQVDYTNHTSILSCRETTSIVIGPRCESKSRKRCHRCS